MKKCYEKRTKNKEFKFDLILLIYTDSIYINTL